MKRFLFALVGLATAVALAACSDDSTSETTTTTTTSTTTPSSTTAPAPTTHSGATTAEQRGADGSTGNNLSAEYCAKNQDPGCPAGSYIGPDAIPNPNGDGTWVPCEGTICTNPNHGAGPEAEPTTTVPPSPNPDEGRVEGAACEGDGRWVHLEGSNAEHYGTEWLCQH